MIEHIIAALPMKEKNNQRADYYNRLIVRVIEQSNKMQQLFSKDVPEEACVFAAESANWLKEEFKAFEEKLRDARQAYLIKALAKESECLDEAFAQCIRLGTAITDSPIIGDTAKEGYFRELEVLQEVMEPLMDNREVLSYERRQAARHDEGSLDARWEARLREKVEDIYKSKTGRGH